VKRVIERTKPKQHILESMIQAHFKEYPDSDKAIIEIKDDKESRSVKQNRLYWEWVSVIGGELGYTKDETHAILRDKFLGYTETTTKLSVIKELRSTTKLKVKEFKDYLEQIDILMSEYGIILPRPEDLYYESMGIKR
jgi:ribosomal protein L7/L12